MYTKKINGLEKIPEALYEEIRSAIRSYMRKYLEKNAAFREYMEIKYAHIHRVVLEIEGIAIDIGCCPEEVHFCQLIAWLHDVGRFEQFLEYQTFSDEASVDHAQLGIEIVKRNQWLDNLERDQVLLIERSILSHNLPQIHPGLTEKEFFYAAMLRDADKLDIWNIALKIRLFNTLHKDNLPKQYEIPADFLNRLAKHQIISMEMANTYYDSLLMRVSWIFNLNFLYCIQQFHERKYLDGLLNNLPNPENLIGIKQIINDFLNHALKQGV